MDIHKEINDKLNTFFETKKIPNLIFHGTSSSGKITIVKNFINKIYSNNKQLIKSNVMMVNCSHGKGIKFIRDELKFFAKSNLNSSNTLLFKTIVLLNADNLTTDAQSALRRCIEQFSHTTRFFMVLENKYKLLQPILSRFCEIYVNEYIKDGKIYNLEKLKMEELENLLIDKSLLDNLNNKMLELIELKESNEINLKTINNYSQYFYENGVTCLDLINNYKKQNIDSEHDKSELLIIFDKIRTEFRYEKLLMLLILKIIFFRSKDDLKSITTI
jgi:DNA polymerase III delta prime subunit